MSGFTNPFAQIGDYRNNVLSSNDELVTTAYLTGLPDPRQITNEQVGLIFRQLLKRDLRTKQRALSEFDQWLNGVNSSNDVEDAIHLAYIQLYAKLCIEISPHIRKQSQDVLGKLYSILGKRSSKYLKYAVGPWITSQYDSDAGVANAARASLMRIFPGDKFNLLVTKFQDSILDFLFYSCNNASAQTLSDERYVTKEESNQKYTRLVKCCLDFLVDHPDFFDLRNWEISTLVESGRLWKFFSSSDSGLARSSLRLAHTHINDLSSYVETIWKELLRAGRKNVGGSGVSLDVLQLMNVLTKRFPEQTWPANEHIRKDALASIGQFITAEPSHSVKFWPLLYNLVLMIPEPPTRDLSPLYKPLEKVVLKLRHNHAVEESVWGCFVSLSGKMGTSYVQRTFKAAEHRCLNSNVPVRSIAKFLARVADEEGVHKLVSSQLEKYGTNEIPFDYILILAETHKFGSIIESYVAPKLPVKDLALLVDTDPEITLPMDMKLSPDPEWLHIATKSHGIDAQHVVEVLASFGLHADILRLSKELCSAGVVFSLDEFVLENLNDTKVLELAVNAHDNFISQEVAKRALKFLVELALQDESQMNSVFRVIRGNIDFVKAVASSDESVRQSLDILSMEDRHGILKDLGDLNISNVKATTSESAVSKLTAAYIKDLNLESLDLSVPIEASANSLRAEVPQYKLTLDEGISSCSKLAEKIDAVLESMLESNEGNGLENLTDDELIKVAVIHEYVKLWHLVAPLDTFQTVLRHMNMLPTISNLEKLVRLTESSNYGVSFHAALAIVNQKPAASISDVIAYSRDLFCKPSLKGALLANYSAVHDNIQYDNLQRALFREAKALRLKTNEWMLIDRSFIPEETLVNLQLEDSKEASVTSAFAISTFRNLLPNLQEIAFESGNRVVEYSALMALNSFNDADSLIDYVVNLPFETGMDSNCLSHCLMILSKHRQVSELPVKVDQIEMIQTLMERTESILFSWIGLQLLKNLDDVPQLYLNLEDSLSETHTLVAWLVTLNFMSTRDYSEKALRNVFHWISAELTKVDIVHQNRNFLELPDFPPTENNGLALNMLYHLSHTRPNAVREWYRDLRDKSFVKKVDKILLSFIIPELLSSVNEMLKKESFGDEVNVFINEKQREIKATRTVEDEFTVELIISLPEQYPGKPATVNIRNLAGVNEAKKRGWHLEALQNLQNGGILSALKSLLLRLNNFLDGIEPCAICYMTVNDLNKLPNKDCSQCHNIYHSDCLYKWISTNGNKLCPMCRAPI